MFVFVCVCGCVSCCGCVWSCGAMSCRVKSCHVMLLNDMPYCDVQCCDVHGCCDFCKTSDAGRREYTNAISGSTSCKGKLRVEYVDHI